MHECIQVLLEFLHLHLCISQFQQTKGAKMVSNIQVHASVQECIYL